MPRQTRLALALTQLRHQERVSVSEIAGRAGVRRDTWRRWEDGLSVPRHRTLRRVEERLDVDRGSLVLLLEEQLKRAGRRRPQEARP